MIASQHFSTLVVVVVAAAGGIPVGTSAILSIAQAQNRRAIRYHRYPISPRRPIKGGQRVTVNFDDGLISVYRLTTGEGQVNVAPMPEGKVNTLVLDAALGFVRVGEFFALDVNNP